MPEFCSCGAQLPPDAIFCHKCGKPQRDVAAEAPVPPEQHFVPIPAAGSVPPEVSAPAPAAPPAMNFRNPVAVRIALLVGAVATVLVILSPLNWLGAGFFAVYLYRRRTGSLLNVRAGARMGWITGVLMAPMFAVIFAAEIFSGQLAKMMEEQLKSWPAPQAQQMIAVATSGPGLVFIGFLMFFVITCLSIAGGALGAKVVGRG